MNLLAALIFFTRLPFWRLRPVPAESFKHVVPYWPLAGWLTGSTMAGVLWVGAQVFSYPVAVLIAIISRLLLTGALHEDGLADFFDGFGGGRDRERILAIMKDSHIGSYGVISLVCYFLLLWTLLLSLPLHLAFVAILAGDAWSKFAAAQLINFLPYARSAEESKMKSVYKRMSKGELLINLIVGALPFMLLLPAKYRVAGLLSIITLVALTLFMKRKLQGYTGDCCGATFLLCELSFYLGLNFFV